MARRTCLLVCTAVACFSQSGQSAFCSRSTTIPAWFIIMFDLGLPVFFPRPHRRTCTRPVPVSAGTNIRHFLCGIQLQNEALNTVRSIRVPMPAPILSTSLHSADIEDGLTIGLPVMCAVDYHNSVWKLRILHGSTDDRSVALVVSVWHFRTSLWTGQRNLHYLSSYFNFTTYCLMLIFLQIKHYFI